MDSGRVLLASEGVGMRRRYTCELHSYSADGGWSLAETWDEVFSRRAVDVARAVLESWIIGHPERLIGGERIVVASSAEELHTINASLRVYVFDGGKQRDDDAPSAVGYLGHDSRDFTGEQPRLV